MKEPTLGNPQNTIEILQKYEFNFQKKFGQNFLIDTHVLDKIISSAEITKDDFVLEIGPGIGTMTQYLACAAREVAAVVVVSPWTRTSPGFSASNTGPRPWSTREVMSARLWPLFMMLRSCSGVMPNSRRTLL